MVATGSYMVDGLIHFKGKKVAMHHLLKLVARWVIKLDVESHDKAVQDQARNNDAFTGRLEVVVISDNK